MSSASSLEGLFRNSRPGSRTVLCDPSVELALEFARRGYRLLIVHQMHLDIQQFRDEFRRVGLASQLMGSQPYSQDKRPTLAEDFYVLWVFAEGAAPLLWEAARAALKKGSLVLWLAQQQIEPPWGEPVASLPESLAGVRVGNE